VTDTSELNFIEELKALESTRKEDGRSIDNQSDVHDDDKIAKKINGDYEQFKGNIIMVSFG